MSEKIYDAQGHLVYEITSGQSAKVYNPQGEIIGHREDNGNIVSDKSGAVIDNVGKKK